MKEKEKEMEDFPPEQPETCSEMLEEFEGSEPVIKPRCGPRSLAREFFESNARYWAQFMVFVQHTATFDTLMVIICSLGSTLFYIYFAPGSEPLVSNLNLSFISFVIIFPITALIGYSFTRREFAIQAIGRMRSYISWHYHAHRDMRNKDLTGACSRHSDPENRHITEVQAVLCTMVRAMEGFLALPNFNETNDKVLATPSYFTNRRRALKPLKRKFLDDIHLGFGRLFLAVERMKHRGLSVTEASRLSQNIFFIQEQWEYLSYIKQFRTPYALRAFARLYVLLHGFFIGPYYAYVAGSHDSSWYSDAQKTERGYPQFPQWPFNTSVVFACVLSLFTSISLQALCAVQQVLEDPFDGDGLDDISFKRVADELETHVIRRVWAGNGLEATMAGGSLLDTELMPSWKRCSSSFSVRPCRTIG